MGAYTEIVDFTFTANETSRTFSGLSITKDDFVKVVFSVANVNTNGQYRIFPNANTTNTNYHVQTLVGSGSNVSAGRGNVNSIGFSSGTNYSPYFYGYIKISQNNKFNMFFNMIDSITTDVATRLNVDFRYCTQTGGADTTSITSLTFQSEAANTISAGSRIQIYKLDAEKVADITVASNTTQVDISNLSIDKDSEYLLVSDIAQNTIELFPNDLTTSTNYHRQVIFGNGSTAGAERSNNANIGGGSTAAIIYTHVKLSNIGAYTYQSYELRGQGTTSPLIVNFFGSSTAENITSITKLNIKADTTNGILTGSRFTLYKLYE